MSIVNQALATISAVLAVHYGMVGKEVLCALWSASCISNFIAAVMK